MNVMNIILSTVAVSLASAASAFAGTAKVYSSGILVLAFVGFCALVVVIQLIPALLTIAGMLRGLMNKREEERMLEAESAD